ncbi:SAM-dependent methyltransferase [Kribbella sp. WER1]
MDLRHDSYPRSNRYAADWLLSRDMGPNPLWLLEDLARDLDLRPGMRVLDLGSGKGATSVFLAQEYGVRVWAADLWVDPTEAAASTDLPEVVTVKAEAHTLPFADGFFDAIVCIDAWEYFGTADNYLAYITRFLAPGGQLGVATPAMTREIHELGSIPEHIRAVVGWEALAWHTPEWWRFQWEVTELVDITAARWQEGGWADWLRWSRAVAEFRDEPQAGAIDMLTADNGQYLGFAILAARKR